MRRPELLGSWMPNVSFITSVSVLIVAAFCASLTAIAAPAVDLSSNTGATINFDGGITIDITTQTGFSATNSGTVNIASGTVSTTTGRAIDIDNTALGITLTSVSSSGGSVPGIDLATTTGSFQVTGDSGGSNNGSGGTIANKTGDVDGVLLNSATKVSLAYMNIDGNSRNGVFGQSVNGFVLNRCNIRNNADQTSPDEAGLHLLELTGTGTAGSNPTRILNTLISNSHENNVKIQNSSRTLTLLDVTGCTISNNGASTEAANQFLFAGTGTAAMTAAFTGNTITGSVTSGMLTSAGIFADSAGGTMDVTVQTCTFQNNNVGVNLSKSGSGSMTFDVLNNSTITGNRAIGINVFNNASSTNTFSGAIDGNTIGTNGVLASGSNFGSGIQVSNEGAGTVTVLIENNTVQEVGDGAFNGFEGLFLIDSVTAGTLNATIRNNTIDQIRDDRAIQVRLTSGGTVNTSISGNTITNIGGSTAMRVSQTSGTYNVEQATPTVAVNPSELDDANGGASVTVSGTINFSQGAPPLPM